MSCLITLIRPPTVSSAHAYSVPITPPIGIAYLAAALESAGHRVSIIDSLGEAPPQQGPTCHPRLRAHGLSIVQIVDRISPQTQLIGVSAMFSQEWPHTEQLILAIRQRFAGVPIVLGGEHATAAWEHTLTTCPAVDLCVLGEGEATLVDLVNGLAGPTAAERTHHLPNPLNLPGIAFRGPDGLVRTSPRPRIRNLDDLPRPAWHLVPIETYLAGGFGHGVNRGRSMPILATRGCPYQCAFCSNPAMWTTRYVTRTPRDVVDEIEHYVTRYRATNIDFYDLTAIVRRTWILEFCRELDARALNITYQLPSGTRSEALDGEVLRWLSRTGCRNITYAPESGSPRMLDRIHKRVNLNRMCDSIRAARRAGIRLKANLVIGFPGETRRDVYRTLRLVLKLAWLGVDDVPLYLFSPYPGSAFHHELQAGGIIGRMDNDYFASLGCFMDLSQSSRYCRQIGPRELNFYRALGMSAGYTVGYLVRPWRIARTALNLWRNQGITVLEQRLCDARTRRLATCTS